MGSSRWPGEPASEADPDPEERSEPGEPGLLGFVAVPDLPSGRHARPVERVRFGTRLVGLLSAAGLPVVALGVGLLASLVAGVSLLVGVVAISRIPDATPVAEPAAEVPSTASPAGPEQSVPPQAVRPGGATAPPTTSVPPSASPAPSYLPAYPAQVLRVARFTCDGTPVDLDVPRVFPPTGADFSYRTCEDGPHLDLDAASRFAVVDVPTATVDDCLDAIRLNPGVGWLTPDRNVTACVLTSPTGAAAQRISQKLVRLRVDSIATDGTLLLSLAAWSVPTP